MWPIKLCNYGILLHKHTQKYATKIYRNTKRLEMKDFFNQNIKYDGNSYLPVGRA